MGYTVYIFNFFNFTFSAEIGKNDVTYGLESRTHRSGSFI